MHVIIIGAGPAGVSAAIYARRSGAETTVIAKDGGALRNAEQIENYYGVPMPLTGAELQQRGMDGVQRLGVHFVMDEVLDVRHADTAGGFRIMGVRSAYKGDAVILAAGAARPSLSVPGAQTLEGRGVSYCAICDAFFYRGRDVAVIGAGEYALHEALHLAQHASHVTLLTNGAEPVMEIPPAIEVITAHIARIDGGKRVTGVSFSDGSRISAAGVFMAIGTAGSSDLARKMGILIDKGNIVVGAQMETNVLGVYAAGDCTGGLLQIVKAAYEGAVAGLAAVRWLRGQ